MSRRPLLLSLLVLVGYTAASFVPLPFLNMALMGQLLADANADAYARTSIVALGILPWLSICILVEMIGTLVAPVQRWRVFDAGHVNPFHPAIIVGALVIAGLQAYGVAAGLQAAGLLRPTIDMAGSLALIASLIGGVALAVLAASLVERYGWGYGFWTLVAVSFLSVIKGAFGSVSQLVVRGVISDVVLAVEMIIVAVTVCGVVWLTRLFADRAEPVVDNEFRVFVWPTLAGLQIAGMAVSGLLVLSPNLEFATTQSGIRIVSVLLAVTSVVFLVLFITVSLRRAGMNKAILGANMVIVGLFLMPYLFELTGVQSNLVWMLLSPLGQFAATVALATVLASRVLYWWSSSPSTTRNRN